MKLFSRIAALVLALALCLGLFSTAIADTTDTPPSAVQIDPKNPGGTKYYDATGNWLENATGLGGDAVVEISKLITGTENENEFEITLQVKTTSRIDTITSGSTDAAVLLIVDLSSSMSEQSVWNKTRLAAAKEALNSFVTQFASLKDENGNTISGQRMVGLITFGSHAGSTNWNLVKDLDGTAYWIDVQKPTTSDTNANLETVKSEINSLSAYDDKSGGPGGTNLEAALMLGRNLLKDGLGNDEGDSGAIRDFKHVYTILLTDGKPTWYVNDNNTSLSSITGTRTATSTDKEDVEDVGKMANGYGTTKGITDYSKLYSICFGKDGNQSVFESKLKENNDNGQGGPGGGGSNNGNWTVTIRKTDYTITNSTTVGTWLGAFSDAAYDGQSSNGQQSLFDLTFNSIIQQITISIEAWQVEDTMGPNVEWISEVPVQYRDGSSFVNVTNSTNSATLNKANNKLQWNILASTPDPKITNTSATTPYVGYTYKYKVRLNNLDGGYDASDDPEGEGTPTNASATLEYAVLDEKGNFVVPEGNTKKTYTATFPQPMVKGLVGKLEFTKVDGNNNPLPGATFTLSLDTDKDKTGTWTSLTATSGADGTVTFSNIPSGHKYKLVETTVPTGYTGAANIDLSVDYKVVSYTNFEKDSENNPIVVNNATTGSLPIEKIFEFNTPAVGTVTTPAPDARPVIVVEVKQTNLPTDASSNPPAPYTTTAILSSENNHHADITVPVGDYTVTEVSDASITGWSLVSTTISPATRNVSSVVNTEPVTITNTYERDTGSLTISKTNEGATPESVKFTVTGPNNYSNTITLNAENSWTETLNNLPTGEYTVTETIGANAEGTADITNYTRVTTFKVNDEKQGTYGISATVLVTNTNTAENPATVRFTNAYKQETSLFTITKSFVNLPDGLWPSVTFEVRSAADNALVDTVVLTAENEWTANTKLLPYGTYTVTEQANSANVAGYSYTVSYAQAGKTENTNTVVIDSPAVVTVTAINTYTQLNELTIHKDLTFESYTLAGISTEPPATAPKSISFTVEGPTGNNSTTRTVTLYEADGWQAKLNDLPDGTYTITETDTPVDGYTYTTTVGGELNAERKTTVTVNSSNRSALVAFANYYTQTNAGELTIKKSFEYLPDSKKPDSITFTLKDSNEKTADIVLNAENGWTYTQKLPIGIYTITEGTATVEGYNYTVKVDGEEANAKTITISSEGQKIEVSFVNKYTQQKGNLTIKKAFAGDLPDSVRPESITFTITPDENTDAQTTTVTLSNNNNWQSTVDLPVGGYYISETSGYEVEGYTHTGVSYNGYVGEGAGYVKIENTHTSETSLVIVCENTYTRDKGSLNIEKQFSFSPAPSTNPAPVATPSAITMVVTEVSPAPSTTPYTTEVILTPDNWSATVDNLPAGQYEVTEKTDGTEISGWTLSTSTTGSVTVASSTNAPSVTITNTYTRDTGKLTISKENKGATPESVTFTVAGPDNYSTTVTLPENGQWTTTLPNLPTGKYTITETNAKVDNYSYSTTVKVNDVPQELTNNSVNVTVSANANSAVTVAFTNTYSENNGTLTLAKSSENDEVRLWTDILSVTLQVRKENASGDIVGTYTLTENNKNVSISLAPGTYYVEEISQTLSESSQLSHKWSHAEWTGGEVVSGTACTVTVKADETLNLVCNNCYEELGSFTITKAFEGNTNDNIYFVVTDVTEGTDYTPIDPITISLSDMTKNEDGIFEYTIYQLHYNTSYKIEEFNADIEGYALTTTWTLNDGESQTYDENNPPIANIHATSNLLTYAFTNTYELKEAVKIEIPVTKVVERGEKGNVDPTGNRTFKFVMSIGEPQAASELDNTSENLPLDKLLVKFNGNTITPDEKGCYYFDLTVNGLGEATGTLTVSFNPDYSLDGFAFFVRELSQTESSKDSCWAYDESEYYVMCFVEDGIVKYRAMHNLPDDQEEELEILDFTFTNVYTKTSTPEIDVPVTGDNSRIGLYMAMMLLSAAGLVVICKRRTAKR